MALIVAGGADDKDKNLKTVEVLNNETRKWHTGTDLPQPLIRSSLTLCGDLVYLLGRIHTRKTMPLQIQGIIVHKVRFFCPMAPNY